MKVKRNRKPLLKTCLCLLALLSQSWRIPAATVFDPLETDVRRDATVRAVETVLPGVVNIATATIKQYSDFYDPIFQRFYGPMKQREELYNIGSGIIIDEDGDVLTNLHVMQRATRAQVKLWDGRVYDVESYIPMPNSDLALLKLRTKPDEKFKPIKFAPDDDLLLGETVIALGNPFGLGGSVSRGILSSKDRRSPIGDAAPDVHEWLQTDAAINPGNSGGPLVNLRGELIGVNSAVGEGQGIGFAIPVKQVALALSEALSPEATDALWFGARVRMEGGAFEINSVQPESPADKAGLRVGDRVMAVDDVAANNLVDLNREIVAAKDHKATLKIERGTDSQTVTVQLLPFDDLIQQKLGMVLLNLSPEAAATFNIGPGKALFVQDVEKGGPADKAQIQKGYLITAIDGKTTDRLATVASLLTSKKPETNVQLSVVVPRRLTGNFVEFRQGTATVTLR